MATRIPNYRARAFVAVKEEFVGSNIYGTNVRNGWYVVYSYGSHWPLHAYSEELDIWFSNKDKYSTTTSKHKSQTWPRFSYDLSLEHMLNIIGKPVSQIREIPIIDSLRKDRAKTVKRSAEPRLRGGVTLKEDA
jgi:hypothetical protein